MEGLRKTIKNIGQGSECGDVNFFRTRGFQSRFVEARMFDILSLLNRQTCPYSYLIN
jgi:hypothetical protein